MGELGLDALRVDLLCYQTPVRSDARSKIIVMCALNQDARMTNASPNTNYPRPRKDVCTSASNGDDISTRFQWQGSRLYGVFEKAHVMGSLMQKKSTVRYARHEKLNLPFLHYVRANPKIRSLT